jgi:hypothetical protein
MVGIDGYAAVSSEGRMHASLSLKPARGVMSRTKTQAGR